MRGVWVLYLVVKNGEGCYQGALHLLEVNVAKDETKALSSAHKHMHSAGKVGLFDGISG